MVLSLTAVPDLIKGKLTVKGEGQERTNEEDDTQTVLYVEWRLRNFDAVMARPPEHGHILSPLFIIILRCIGPVILGENVLAGHAVGRTIKFGGLLTLLVSPYQRQEWNFRSG